jgi:predicted dehydrogenase
MKILFLGCGYASRLHSGILRSSSDVGLQYASRDASRAEARRREFDGAHSFGSYDEALAQRGDIAVVATVPSTHLSLTLAALQSGRHVVVEKPAFMHASDADVVRHAAAASGRRVFVAENYPYKAVAGHIRRMVTGGDLGDVRLVSINATKRQDAQGWRADRSLGGGDPLFEGGVHWLSFAASLGMEVESVHGFATSGVDTSLVVMKYTNGAVGSLAFSWELRAPFGCLRLSKVQGTHGAITFESNGLAMLATGPRLQVRLPALGDPTGRRAMWLDFLRALRTGAETRYTLDMAQRDLRMVELCRTQRREVINDPLRSHPFADQNQANSPLTV